MEKQMDTSSVMTMLSSSLNDNLSFTTNTGLTSGTMYTSQLMTCWDYWQSHYYPIIRESYPVYIQERAKDKGKQAFEIIKMLKDSKFLKLDTVRDFIDLMDKLIKIL